MTFKQQKEALDLLVAVHGEDSLVAFQIFDDSKNKENDVKPATLHRPINKRTLTEMARLNSQGAGVFHTIHETNGKSRMAKDIVKLNALAMDYDNCEPSNLELLPTPSIVVQSKNGKHLYWLLSDESERMQLDKFTPYQQMIAAMTGGDSSVSDLPRVLRLPGFNHVKDPSDPFQVFLVSFNPELKYTLSDFPTPDPNLVKAAKKSSGKAKHVKLNGTTLEQIAYLREEYRRVVGVSKMTDKQFKYFTAKAVDILKDGKLGVNGNKTVLAAARAYGAILTLTDAPAENVMNWLLELSIAHFSEDSLFESKWNETSDINTIYNGFRYALQNKVSELRPEDNTIEGAITGQAIYVGDLNIDYKAAKITGLQSAIGTGKTTDVVRVIKEILAADPTTRIRLFCHRVALVKQWVGDLEGLDFTAYDDSSKVSKDSVHIKFPRYIGTYDALLKFTGWTGGSNSVIILDEFDQAVNYLLLCPSTDVAKNRLVCWDSLKILTQCASKVIVASATLSPLEVMAVEYLAKFHGVNATSQYYVNTQLPKAKTFHKVDTEAMAVQKVVEMLKSGKNVYLATDSKEGSEAYTKLIGEQVRGLKVACINASTKHKYDLTDINKTVQQFQLVVASPTLGTGTNIDCDHFHSVTGIFTNRESLGYGDCLQAVGRVRNPLDNSVYVYIDDTYKWRPTSEDEVADKFDINTKAMQPFIRERRLTQFMEVELVLHSDIDMIQKLQIQYTARQERSKLARGYKFWQAVTTSGHELAGLGDVDGQVSRKDIQDTRKVIRESKAEDIVAARVLTREESQSLMDKERKQLGALSDSDQLALTRYFISSKLSLTDLTVDDILWYNKKGEAVIDTMRLLSISPETANRNDRDTDRMKKVSGGFDGSFSYRNQSYLIRLSEALKPVIESGVYQTGDSKLGGVLAVVHELGCDEVRKLGVKVYARDAYKTVTSLLNILGYETKSVRKGRDSDRTSSKVISKGLHFDHLMGVYPVYRQLTPEDAEW